MSTPNEIMQHTVDALHGLWFEVSSDVAFSMTADAHAREISATVLAGYSKTIDDLGGPLRDRVLNGLTTLTQWKSVAEACWQGIVIAGNYTASTTFAAMWEQVAKGSLETVARLVPSKLSFGLGLGVLALVAVAVIVVKLR